MSTRRPPPASRRRKKAPPGPDVHLSATVVGHIATPAIRRPAMIFSLTRKTVSIAALALALARSAAEPPPAGQPSFYRSLAGPAAELDAVAAASMISGYRQNNALAGVALDPTLMRLARQPGGGQGAGGKA